MRITWLCTRWMCWRGGKVVGLGGRREGGRHTVCVKMEEGGRKMLLCCLRAYDGSFDAG